MHGCSDYGLGAVLNVVLDLSLQRRQRAVRKTGLDTKCLFSFTPHAYDAGGCSSANGATNRVSCDQGTLSEPRPDCALDVPNLDVRLSYWRDRLPDVVSVVRANQRTSRMRIEN